MKKIKFNDKLSLNKETVVTLNDEQMNNVQGGGTILTTWYNCTSKCYTKTEYTCETWSHPDVTCAETQCVHC